MPSDYWPFGQHGGELISLAESFISGTHPPYPSDSHPLTQVTLTVFGIQFPFPSLAYPEGHTYGRETFDEFDMQLPFPSLLNPDAQIFGIYEATHTPFPSLVYPVWQFCTVGGETILADKIQFPNPSEWYPSAHATNDF